MYFFFISIIFTLFSYNIFSSENIPKIDLSFIESHNLIYTYNHNPWKKVEKYHQKHTISFNTLIFEDQRLIYHLLLNLKIDNVNHLLDKEEVIVDFHAGKDKNTLLHVAASRCPCKETEQNPYMIVIQKLIEKNCPLNAVNIRGRTALEEFYVFGWKGSSKIFIKNGALLLVKEEDKRSNILDDDLGYLGEIYFGACHIDNTLRGREKIVKDVLYNKCKYDYKNYCKAFLNIALVCKRMRAEKNIVFPKVLMEHITSFITPHPIQHIEDTLHDAWSNQSGYEPTLLETHESEDIKNRYNDLILHTTPGAWRDAWHDFKNKKSSETNLIQQALQYKG